VVDILPKPNLLLIQPSVLPPVFQRVVEAKQLLASGTVKTASEAARLSGISRSAFYKYRDCVFAYNPAEEGRIITIHTVLRDSPGVLSTLIGRLAENGANILTVNQNIPIDGAASVSLSIRTKLLRSNLEELIDALRQIDGVVSLEQILGE
jgi:chorismate mutase